MEAIMNSLDIPCSIVYTGKMKCFIKYLNLTLQTDIACLKLSPVSPFHHLTWLSGSLDALRN